MSVNLLPQMARLGRNSILTRQLARAIAEKLLPGEQKDFAKWLQIVEDDKRIELRKAQRRSAGLY